jgi:1,2-phenylacetyl-CoA epoxidase PaaB subunit
LKAFHRIKESAIKELSKPQGEGITGITEMVKSHITSMTIKDKAEIIEASSEAKK